MEKKMTTPFLFILLHLLQFFAVRPDDSSCLPQKSLTCHNDFSHNITCIWKGSFDSDQRNNACLIYAERVDRWQKSYKFKYKHSYNASCELQSFDSARPALKKCSLTFNGTFLFFAWNEVLMNLSCSSSKQNETLFYKPVCHIKVNPPGKPNVNQTTVTWFTQVKMHMRITDFLSELQWKQKDKSWNDPTVVKKKCKWDCEAQLRPNLLMKDETYEARVRVQAFYHDQSGDWSEWSPTESWVSQVGSSKPASGKMFTNINEVDRFS
ncbi:hypothetical protein XENORESO_009523 [Xenotaenia resolanae]|uniref:Interleukin-2 receptor subunit beta n=1 Tax=Xenotaenia resolanae TaxID=208358 RepID=A0ABV0WQA3_9TELE